MRARSFLLLVTTLLAFAPAPGGAAVQQVARGLSPRIDSISPDVVDSGSGPVQIEIAGQGFRDGSGRATIRSRVLVDFEEVEATVVDGKHISAIVPPELLEDDGDLPVVISNTSTLAPYPSFRSNTKYLRVRRVAERIEFDLSSVDASVGDCFGFGLKLVDAYGGNIDEPATFALTSDDVATTEANDGGVEFFDNYCGSPNDGSFEAQYGSVWIWSRSSSPRSVVITARTSEGLVAQSPVIRFAGGHLEGAVRGPNDEPVAGVKVFVVDYLATDDEHQPSFLAIPGQYPWCYRGMSWREDPFSLSGGDYYPYFRLGDPVGTTDAEGRFLTDGIAAGPRAFYFLPPAGSGLAAGWSGDATDPRFAQKVLVSDGGTAQLDPKLVQGGTISGRLARGDGSEPIGEAAVVVRDPVSRQPLAVTAPDENGFYRTPGLPPGEYHVWFQPKSNDYVNRFYPGARFVEDAVAVTVTAGAETDAIDEASPRGAVVEGGLTLPGGNTGGNVSLFDALTGTKVATAWIDEGRFATEPGVPEGDYKLLLEPGDPRYVPTWFGNATSFASAETFHLGAAEHKVVTVEPTRGASFAGVVNMGEPTGLLDDVEEMLGTSSPPRSPTVRVDVFDADTGERRASACTDEDGSFRTGGVPTGSYKIRFTPQSGTRAPQWYPDAPDRGSAEVVEVRAGETKTLTASPHDGAAIGGQIYDADGEPIADEDAEGVYVYATLDGEPLLGVRGSVASDGTYRLTGLAPGSYRVAVYDYRDLDNGLVTWAPDAPASGSATPVVIQGSSSVGGVDVTLGSPSFIEGTVSGFDPSMVYAWGEVVDAASGESVEYVRVDKAGTYRTDALRGGTYNVLIKGVRSRVSTWVGGSSRRAGAHDIEVPDGSTVAGFDVTLPAGRRMSGRVTAAHSGLAVDNVGIRVVDAQTAEVLAFAITGTDGFWRTQALPVGDVKVSFGPMFDPPYTEAWHAFEPQWFVGRNSFSDADVLTLNGAADAAGINIELALRN